MNNRNYKDSVFVDYFDKDEKVGAENFLALYNAIHCTNLSLDELHFEHKEIDNAIYHDIQNFSLVTSGCHGWQPTLPCKSFRLQSKLKLEVFAKHGS